MNRAILLLGVAAILAAGCEPANAGSSSPAQPRAVTVRITVDRAIVPIGRCIVVHARAIRSDRRPAVGLVLWSGVNGRRWGAPQTSDESGRAKFVLPLPRRGTANLQVAASAAVPAAFWIWDSTTTDRQSIRLKRTFQVVGRARDARMFIDADDSFVLRLNGRQLAGGSDFHKVHSLEHFERWLAPGTNTLEVDARNAVGPAGVLARLEYSDGHGTHEIVSDPTWRLVSVDPGAESDRSRPAAQIARVGGGVWGASIRGWPGLAPDSMFPTGAPFPPGSSISNLLKIRVVSRKLHVDIDPAHRVGIEWEPWFTPHNADWSTAEAIPLVGKYDSDNADVIRQHVLWLDDAGIDYILVDWSNNLWGKQHWSQRDPNVQELVQATIRTLDTYADLRDEGIPVPQIALLIGLDNGPQTTTSALREEMDWVYSRLVTNPRYRGLWLMYQGRPLIVAFNGGGPAIRAHQPPLEDTRFTLRWMASQLQVNHLEHNGYWSWMDGVIDPIPTFTGGIAEALTVTPAFFGDGGWTYQQASGRRSGATYIREFQSAFRYRPRFLIINQWNEFAGQPEGGGYGANHDQYVDSYTAELSNDIEPTSTTARGCHGDRGWGFQYLDLTRRLIRAYRDGIGFHPPHG